MSPPTLFQLAVKSLAQGIHEGKIPFDFNLDTKSSNAVFRELLKWDPKHFEKLKTHRNQLSKLTELDLRKCEIDKEGVLNLKNFKLHSLEFGILYRLKTKFPHAMNPNRIDIVCLLETVLNINSQKMIVHLGFHDMEECMNGWEENISKLFPSLQSIKIQYKEFNEQCHFSKLCNSFPNLRILDISYANGLSTLKGIKNIKSLQKLVMRDVRLDDRDGYKELSELKNLRVLDVSSGRRRNPIVGFRSLLESKVRIENLEFLDCSMTYVQEHELREFVEHHKALKTVVAISTACDNLSIPTIDLLNFVSPTSFGKCLKYAITNERDNLAVKCMKGISATLNTNYEQLNESEISEFLKILCYVLREAKDEETKHEAISCFASSDFFGTERFFSSCSLEIPGIVELVFKTWDNLKRPNRKFVAHRCVVSLFQRIVNFLRFGRILQNGLLSFIMDKTSSMYITETFTPYGDLYKDILMRANRFMSVDQYAAMCNNTTVIEGLFKLSHNLIQWNLSSHQQIMKLIVSYMNQASEDTLKFLVSNGQIVENCIEQIMMISQFPTKDSQNHLLHLLLVFSSVMSDEQLKKCYGGETVFSLLLIQHVEKPMSTNFQIN
ncbi:hypothetical protein B9Z55_004894 [Caenorhabditis nigoni]|uniref:Zer-1-like leucine-rich repeats region domain-containing protein n=1 Tax=Caenorhabditis nigoni TaxID=1611254 RepID=A0A2G5UYI9_9PELO|nr:hypothetical protein B9Z55_004894 [Caenorhabditis nigoni]